MPTRFTRNTAFAIAPLLLLVVLLLLAVPQGYACSWAIGFFYQVTALKGRVVGTHSHLYFPGWLRQSFARKHVKLAPYEYRWPRTRNSQPFRTVETDGEGIFDFGSVSAGHYTLVIGDEDSFDVEVKEKPNRSETLTIDVSPVSPDCTGGHELIVKTE